MLARSEEVTGAPEPQVLLRDLETVSGLGHDLQPLPRLLVSVVGDQDAVGLMLPPPHPAPQLVELGEAEPLRVLDHHHRGVGHIHPHLDDGGGHQNVRLVGSEGGHDGVLLLGLHLAVDEGHLEIRKHLGLELFGVFRHRLALVGELVILLYHGTDDIGLAALAHQLADETVHPLVIAPGDGEGLHRLAAGGKLVDDGHVQVSVEDQGQGPGDGGSGHDQNVGVVPLGGQFRPLGHTEAVLLIRHHQAQVAVGHAAGDEGVGADGKVDLPALQLLSDGPFRLGGGGAGQQGAPDTQIFQQRGQALVVLLGQDLRRGHQGRLAAILHHEVHAGGGHHGLSGTHVSLTEPVHGRAGAHVRQCFLHTAALSVRQGEGQGTVEKLHVHAAARGHVDHLPAGAEPLQPDGEEEQLLKGQPPPG